MKVMDLVPCGWGFRKPLGVSSIFQSFSFFFGFHFSQVQIYIQVRYGFKGNFFGMAIMDREVRTILFFSPKEFWLG